MFGKIVFAIINMILGAYAEFNIGNTMLQMAGSLAIVAATLVALSFIFGNEKLKNAMDTGAAVEKLLYIAGGLLAFVFGLSIIQKKIKAKSNDNSFAELGDVVLKLAGAMAVLSGLAVAIGIVTKLSPGLMGNGLKIMALLAVAILGILALLATIQNL